VEQLALRSHDRSTTNAEHIRRGDARDFNPQWSPDGCQVAFILTCGEKPQLHIIPVDGGEARVVTALKQGVGGGPA
jgi:Tol biopolymer transport system component